MAASGINEHKEACRKQMVVNRQTYMKKYLMDQVMGRDTDGNENVLSRASKCPPGHLGPVSSYDLEKHHKHSGAAGTDRARRSAVRDSQYMNYSAKINGRLSSTNYNQQW